MKIVSLTTDYGDQDYYTAQLKAAILNRLPTANLIDISHTIKPYDIVEGAFYLQNVYKRFPKGSIHIGAVQVYHYNNDQVIVFEKNGHYFIGPNNGMFSLVFQESTDLEVYEVTIDRSEYPFIMDTYAHGVAALGHGLSLGDIGTRIDDFVTKIGIQPVKTSNQIRATIIHIDMYGNVIVNLTKEVFENIRQQRRFKIFYKSKDPITQLSKHYGSVQMGEVLAYFNASGYLEIAINMANAHELLSLRKHETIQIDFFE